ncbi:hypothetical protein CU098_009143 [Rhizopus stolonifer]|uniref:Uncharacterized protein n=1 Tax=Rhizopus stolonifer TaxID=4846 RepID=A0A367J0U9_RHIST|nr:hypothetical protein CU098_009143 [Rhizopus stolonifer]
MVAMVTIMVVMAFYGCYSCYDCRNHSAATGNLVKKLMIKSIKERARITGAVIWEVKTLSTGDSCFTNRIINCRLIDQSVLKFIEGKVTVDFSAQFQRELRDNSLERSATRWLL